MLLDTQSFVNSSYLTESKAVVVFDLFGAVQLVDSRGTIMVPKTDVTFGDGSGPSGRRKLLKGKGGGSSSGGRR